MGTASSLTETTTAADLSREELDILETVFRFQLGRDTSGEHPERFLLSLWGEKDPWKDPPTEFLARFQGNVPPVEPISVAGPHVTVCVHGGETSGIILHLLKIRRLDKDTAEVDGDYYSALRASGDTYRVERRAAAWMVVKDGMRCIY